MSLPTPPQARPLPRSAIWPRLGARHLVALALLVLAAAAGGWALRAATDYERAKAPPSPPREVVVGNLSVRVPAGWAPVPAARADVPGLEAGASVFAPAPGITAYAIVSTAAADDPSLVPAPLRALAKAELGRPRKAALAGMPAWRYRELAIEGGRTLQVTVAPTSAGVVTVACVAPAQYWVEAVGCAGQLSGASLTGAEPLEPSAKLAFQARMPAVVEDLGDRRAALRERLRGATTRRGQARFADRLALAHARAAGALSALAPPSGAPREVESSLRAAARGYLRLSAAAANGWPKRYRMARREIRAADASLARAVPRAG